MSEFLYHYHPVEPATWFYLSSLLTIGLFFKFSRFWSVRNLDLLLLILLGPGLLFIYYGRQLDRTESSPGQPAPGQQTPGATDSPELGPGAASETGSRRPPPNVERMAANRAAPTAGGIQNETLAGRRELLVEAAMAADTAEPGTDEANRATAEPIRAAPSELPEASAAADESSAPLGEDSLEGVTGEPGETVLSRGQRIQKYGYLWLFCAGGLLLARLLADPTMVRRPLLEPNLSAGGLTFIGCSLFIFLMANVISRPAEEVAGSESVAVREESSQVTAETEGPGYALLATLPSAGKKVIAILAHLTVVLGMVLIGYRHFDNIVMGIGAATLYLMLPYTALMTNEIKHVLPAAAMVWAVLSYRRPLTAGAFLGLAGGATYYPLFLLPLWLSFYWPRGLLRFVVGVVSVLIALLFVLFSSHDVLQNIRLMFGLYPPPMQGLRGIWDLSLGGWSSYYRIPVLAAFVALASSLALWPAQKNLGTLLSCSAAVMVATQFWHGYGGGEYMAWYLPLLLLTIFRPNLEDRVALTVLAEGWLPRRLSALPSGRAAFTAVRSGG